MIHLFIKNVKQKEDYRNISKNKETNGFTLAQKIVGKACGM